MEHDNERYALIQRRFDEIEKRYRAFFNASEVTNDGILEASRQINRIYGALDVVSGLKPTVDVLDCLEAFVLKHEAILDSIV